MKINDELTLRVEDITDDGNGISKYNNIVIFIEKAIPKDYVKVKITSKKKNFYKAVILDIIESSPYRQAPICKHFGICGGCKWLHFKYEQLLEYKEKQVYDQLDRIGTIKIDNRTKINPSPKTLFYRNKLEFTFNHNNENNTENKALGFHVSKCFDKVIDIENCYLQPEPSNKIRNFIRKWVNKNEITYYNSKTHRGLLRNLIIRNNSTNDFMVIIVVSEYHKKITELAPILFEKFNEIKSFYVIINNKLNSSLEKTTPVFVYGSEFLKENINGIEFKIRPLSFFQTNVDQFKIIHNVITQFVKDLGGNIVYDLYCGVGTISLAIAKHVNKVIGIDNSEMAIKDATENAYLNSINNAEFFLEDLSKFFNQVLLSKNNRPEMVITDPPRSGMHKNVLFFLKEVKPRYIIYLSCNTSTQARDLKFLKELYDVIYVQPFDMFPFTSHTENLCVLRIK
ncbi:MAG: 23S rRNA (uracil(1939)-C(5))-methyltransferase RlmD [Bacteroidales bacterium]|nr:23S rRNA (uracil(1939)-C(5))-methyltransferase RlmD [Bacteroidales bacterium]